ncbi:MAG: ferritin-like domain-containing protein [Parafilimonas sp.]
MNLQQIFSDLEKQDPEIYNRLDSRRDSMKEFARIGGKIALTALPLALGGMFKKAYGQTSYTITQVLNFALVLEHLESQFYTAGVNTPGLIPEGNAKQGYMIIQQHENEHVAFLSSTITALGGTPQKSPTFDFTAGGTFPTVFSDYATFLAVSQTLEDTGVRAYKGQATHAQMNDTVLTAALQIHSVEARHASYVRSLRSAYHNDETIRPWITGNSTAGIGSSVAGNYAGEENTVQLGIQIKNIDGFDITFDDASESFDEPLTTIEVLRLVQPFIVQ